MANSVAVGVGLCAATIARNSDSEQMGFAAIFDSAVTGTSVSVACAAVALFFFRLSSLSRRGTDVCKVYTASFVASVLLQLSAYIANWSSRVWCPGIVNEPFCRANLLITAIAEAVTSFTVLYIVSDRLRSVLPREGNKEQQSQERPQSVLSSESSSRASTAVFLFWASSIVVGIPTVISNAVRKIPGTAPICDMWGHDGVSFMIFHSSIVYIMPVSFILTKNAGSWKEQPIPDRHWHLVSRALIFYALHFMLTVPMVVAKSLDYVFRCDPFIAFNSYYELAATLVFLFRLLNYVAVMNVLERKGSKDVDAGDRDDSSVSSDPKKRDGYSCCWWLSALSSLVVRQVFPAVVSRVRETFEGMRRRLRRCSKKYREIDDEKKRGLPDHDELSVTVEGGSGGKTGFINPGYDDSDRDSGYAVDVSSVAEDVDQQKSAEEDTFVGGKGADIENPRFVATHNGVALYAINGYTPEETRV